MRTERRKSGSARGDEKLAAERRYGVHRLAKAIRQAIREELSLTASAGVAPNKFLAKIASDWRKPDGLFVIQPEDLPTFLPPLPVARIPGVGKVSETRLKQIGILTVSRVSGDHMSVEQRKRPQSLRFTPAGDCAIALPDRGPTAAEARNNPAHIRRLLCLSIRLCLLVF